MHPARQVAPVMRAAGVPAGLQLGARGIHGPLRPRTRGIVCAEAVAPEEAALLKLLTSSGTEGRGKARIVAKLVLYVLRI